MKYSTIISPDSEPKTLTESMQRAVKELSYLDTFMTQTPINLSPFKKTEDLISPSEYVTKFIREQFTSK